MGAPGSHFFFLGEGEISADVLVFLVTIPEVCIGDWVRWYSNAEELRFETGLCVREFSFAVVVLFAVDVLGPVFPWWPFDVVRVFIWVCESLRHLYRGRWCLTTVLFDGPVFDVRLILFANRFA